MQTRFFWVLIFGFVIVGVITVFIAYRDQKEPYYNEIHIHSDFKVYLNGEFLDFADIEYQSGDETARHSFLHLHDNDGDVLHIHAKGQSFASFLTSLGMSLTKDCFTKRNGDSFCREDGLNLFVNGKKYQEGFDSYLAQDLDRVLLTNASEDTEALLTQLTDKACIHSGKCPDRGSSEESCLVSGACSKPPRIEPLGVEEPIY